MHSCCFIKAIGVESRNSCEITLSRPWLFSSTVKMSKEKLYLLKIVIISLFSLCCSAGNETCPTWLHLSEEGWCVCGSSLGYVNICNNETQQVSILRSFCLTTFDKDPNESVVGSCLFTQNHGQSTGGKDELYVEANKNLSLQDQQLCGYLNCQGQLCGECKSNHFHAYNPFY